MRFRIKSLCLLGVLCTSVVQAVALDREAFTFTNYDLDVRVEPDQHRLGVRGKITLRNDSATAQKTAVLQISSSLDWRSIKALGNALQFVSQPFTSDIDHTGSLSEAIVTLPQPVPPKGSIELEIGYEGVILLDATRLTRMGAPEAQANSTDWDQIRSRFTGVRGIGYVAWYPIATESADLSEPNSLSETLGRWKRRHSETQMSLIFESTQKSPILCSGTPSGFVIQTDEDLKFAAFSIIGLGINVPAFAMAAFKKLDVKGISTVAYFPGSDDAASSYADVLASLDPLPGPGSRRLQVVQLPDPEAAPFVSDALLLTPLTSPVTQENRLMLTYAVARQEVRSPSPWIVEGLAHLAQLMDIERQHGRQAALDYLSAHRSFLLDYQRAITSTGASINGRSSAINGSLDTMDDAYLQSKAMFVWWMLRDMIGSSAMSVVVFSYRLSDDKDSSHMQSLLEKSAHRNLQWFFDDWVYRDRGLPDFKVESEFSRKTLGDAYIVTVTVVNLGAAGAEVPVMLKFAGGEVAKRLEVRGGSKGVVRFEVPATPQEVVVNDGSVPESDMTNNTFKIEATAASK